MTTLDAHHDPAANLHLRPRPRASQLSLRASTPWSLRLGVLVLLAFAHVVLLQWIDRQSWIGTQPRDSEPLYVLLLESPSPPPPASPAPARAPRPAPGPRARSRPLERVTPSAPPDARADPAAVAVPEPPPLRLYRADGSLLLPEDVLKDLARVDGTQREFSFQTPGLVATIARAPRRKALEYEATRFEDAWVEEQDPITEALAKAVEKTTVTVRIPLPRSPGTKYVCKITLAMMAGSCGFVNANDGQVVVLNDPATLNAIEDATCQAWWEALVRAETQSQWQAARIRYQRECRKPRDVLAPMPM